jgi:DNA-directed RNA polymerase subunit M/transcription elongation factor TFIIS
LENLKKIKMKVHQPILFRQNVRARLHPDAHVGLRLEQGVYNAAIVQCKNAGVVRLWSNSDFIETYTTILNKTMHGLETPDIIARLGANPERLASMSHQEIAPHKWSELQSRKQKQEELILHPKHVANTNLFKCPKPNCRSTSCEYQQMQTRSADEPMTTYVNCLNCGHHWRC